MILYVGLSWLVCLIFFFVMLQNNDHFKKSRSSNASNSAARPQILIIRMLAILPIGPIGIFLSSITEERFPEVGGDLMQNDVMLLSDGNVYIPK